MNERGGWWGRLLGSRAPGVVTAAAFQAFLAGHAARIAQKTVTEYCQVKAGRMWPQLSTEAPFIEELGRARWEAFGAILEDVMVIAEGFLRPAAGARAPMLPERLARVYADALAAQPRPAHRAGGWADLVERAGPRLAAAAATEPVRPYVAAEIGGHRMFEVLPFHPSVRELDEPMIVNSVAFQLVALLDQMRREVDPAPVAAELLAGTGER